ncbi:MAG TPA: hypothetical protein VEP90_11710, partial [Methylomirabilota bacterium]|nr:hypothetical protein [Methylomirabilota bacterium]
MNEMWDCDIESYDWFRRFDGRYLIDDLITDFEEVKKEFEDAFMDIKAPKEIMIDYETQEDVGIGEISSFVYGYSMTIELEDKPRVSSRSSKKRKVVSEYNEPQITSEREPLAEVNVYDKEVKVVLEMP